MPAGAGSKRTTGSHSRRKAISKSQRGRSAVRKRTQEPPEGHVVVGRVTGSWGLRGDLKVQPQTDFPERFSQGSELHIDSRRETVVSARPSRGVYVIRLSGVTNRTEADSMRGALLTVPEDNLASLPEDTYYHFQLIDMQVFSDEGESLGVIVEILDTSANDVYVIRGESGPELLIPAIREVVLSVDVDGGRMTVHLPPGLR